MRSLNISVAAVVALLCSNCGRKPEATNRFVPAPELARAALEAVLVDWKEGLPPLPINRLAVTVNFVDQRRTKGQALADFEILGETPSASGRCLVVRLKYSQPETEESARYVVVGIDPLWVFRQQDLDELSHWDDDMSADSSRESQPGRDVSQNPIDAANPIDEVRIPAPDPIPDGQ